MVHERAVNHFVASLLSVPLPLAFSSSIRLFWWVFPWRPFGIGHRHAHSVQLRFPGATSSTHTSCCSSRFTRGTHPWQSRERPVFGVLIRGDYCLLRSAENLAWIVSRPDGRTGRDLGRSFALTSHHGQCRGASSILTVRVDLGSCTAGTSSGMRAPAMKVWASWESSTFQGQHSRPNLFAKFRWMAKILSAFRKKCNRGTTRPPYDHTCSRRAPLEPL